MQNLVSRLRVWKRIVHRPLVVAGFMYSAAGAFNLWKSEFASDKTQADLKLDQLTPSWSLETWLIIALAIALAGILEGAFHEIARAEKEAAIRPIYSSARQGDSGQMPAFHFNVYPPEPADSRTLIGTNVHVWGQVTSTELVWIEDIFVEVWQRRGKSGRKVVAVARMDSAPGSKAYQMAIGLGAKCTPEEPLIIGIVSPALFKNLYGEPSADVDLADDVYTSLVLIPRPPVGRCSFDLPNVRPTKPVLDTGGSSNG